MPRLLPLTVFFVGWLAAPLAAVAAPSAPLSHYVHEAWTSAQGLPQNSVTALLQTRDGFLWLGTQEGLARFDGVTFERFNKGNTPAFSHNEVTALAEAPDGTLWIGTYGGLLEYRGGRFTAHRARHRERDAITALAVDRRGVVWIGTTNAGLNRFEEGRFEFFSAGRGLASNVVNDVALDAAGDVYVATAAGLSVRHGDRWTTIERQAGSLTADAWRVLPGPDGTTWIATRQGLAVLRDGVARPANQPPALAGSSVRSLARERSGALWAGTENGTAWRWDGSAWSSTTLSDAVEGNYLWTIAEDREGSVWIGTYTAGLHRLWRGRFGSLTHRDGLAADDVRVVLQARSGEVWIATEAMGLTRLEGSIATHFGTADGLPNMVVRTLFEDSRGVLWAGTRTGLAYLEGARFRAVPGAAVSVRALAEDAHGTIWVGTSTDGVHRLVAGALVDLDEDGRTQLPRGIVRAIARDHAGAMWVGTDDGLVRVGHGGSRVFTADDGMPDQPTYAIHEDAQHVLWLGTYGGGLVRIKGGKVTRYTQAVGLFDDVVYQVLEDRAGRLWLSCNNGVFSVEKTQLDAFADGTLKRIASQPYGTDDGMLSRECNGNAQPAGWATADGRLWFPTTAGVSIVDPSDLHENALPPLVAIEQVVADGRRYLTGERAELPAGTSHVELEYAGLSFISHEKVAFRYRLDGFDREWVDAGSRRQTVYTNLPPGEYVFRVAARNNDGVWSASDARFAFVLQPRLHQTWWFRGLLVLASMGLVIGAVRLRDWQHVQRERELTRRVEQALGRVKVLSGLLPICANCKKIRDDRGYWSLLEHYLKEHSEAQLSHGLCPDCLARTFAEFDDAVGRPPGMPPEQP